MSQLSAQLALVHKRIIDAQQHFGRMSEQINLLPVTKNQPTPMLEEAVSLGLRCFGENYVQEALPKIAHFHSHALEWHFIGTIQRNKTKLIATHFDWVHTLTHPLHAERLNEQRPLHLPPLQICIEVNTSQEKTKSGISFDEIPALANAIASLPRLKLRGLMTIPTLESTFEKQRIPFKHLKMALLELQAQGFEVDTLSMGMSADLEAAIAEGATIVRVGTAIFGERGSHSH